MKCHAKFPLWARGQPRYSRRLGLRCAQTIKKKILGERRQGKNYVNILPLFRNATNAAECAFRPLATVCQRFRRGWGRGLVTTPRLREVTGGRSRQPGGRARQEHFLILFSKLEINLSVLCTD